MLTKKLALTSADRSTSSQRQLTEIGKVKLKLTNSLIFKLVYSVQSYETFMPLLVSAFESQERE